MHATLAELEREMRSALAGLDEAGTRARPPGGFEKWSIQQIVEHLLLSYQSTVGALERRIDKQTPTRARISLQQRAVQLLLLRWGYFPSGREAPLAVTPDELMPAEDATRIVERFHEELDRLDRTAAAAAEILGAGRCVTHGQLGPLSIDDWRRFHLVHGRHHLRQIRAIRRQHAF